MEIILKADVQHLGKLLDVVQVKSGYARNFLFPRNLAMPATREAKRTLEKNREAMEALFRKELAASEDIATKISATQITIERSVVENERLYGSVSSSDIAASLKALGFNIAKRQIVLAEPIKQLGNYSVPVKVFSGVEATLSVWVTNKKEGKA
ncbi:MAG: 50S ribosomal protein L9 [Fibromonadaceae bacterium]|jgi:large subunit ribosomal protein L9|nr:50S ribosomal protein L9 [Fibromonadaceae bacterium]